MDKGSEIELLDRSIRIWCKCGRDTLHLLDRERAVCQFCNRRYSIRLTIEIKELEKDR